MRAYLTCYDYGQGGVWIYIDANSPSEITDSYPDLIVFEVPPAWWNEEMEKQTRKHNVSDTFWQEWLSKLKR